MFTLHNLSNILESTRTIMHILEINEFKGLDSFQGRLLSVANGPNGDMPPEIRRKRETEAFNLLNALVTLNQAVSDIAFAPILGPDTRR
jgi:hypothetical protein